MRKSIQSAITVIKKTNQSPVAQTIRFNSNGESDENKKKKFLDQDAVAVQVATDYGPTYKIKCSWQGKLYNPKMEKAHQYTLQGRDRTTGRLQFDYKPVTQKSFEYYIKFLQTQNDTLFVSAEREK